MEEGDRGSEPGLPHAALISASSVVQVQQTQVEGSLYVTGLALDLTAQGPQSRGQAVQALLGTQS